LKYDARTQADFAQHQKPRDPPDSTQARNQVLRFGGKYHFRGKEFRFYYMFKTKSSGHNKIW